MSCSRVSVYFLAWKHFVCSILFVRGEYIGLMKLGDHGLDSKTNLAQPKIPQSQMWSRGREDTVLATRWPQHERAAPVGGPQGRGVHMESVSTWTKATATSSLLSWEGPTHTWSFPLSVWWPVLSVLPWPVALLCEETPSPHAQWLMSWHGSMVGTRLFLSSWLLLQEDEAPGQGWGPGVGRREVLLPWASLDLIPQYMEEGRTVKRVRVGGVMRLEMGYGVLEVWFRRSQARGYAILALQVREWGWTGAGVARGQKNRVREQLRAWDPQDWASLL